MNTGFKVLTVSQLNFYVRSQLEADPMLSCVFVRGEISNFTNHYRSGHLYMSLKDDTAVIKAVMFRGSAQHLNFVPQNGMKVIAMGRVSLYDRDGQYQFYIDDLQPDGVGALHVAFEQLKARLSDEGLFNEDRKKPLPQFASNIGVITSPSGAALQDMLNILRRRWPLAQVLLYPVLVQGDGAPEQICKALDYFSRTGCADVVVVGRGGGSIEDLWAFNSESVARSIAACKTPVVSAVGHETDYTISDFAADMRAPTPSAAAELISPDIDVVSNRLQSLIDSLNKEMRRKLDECTQRFDTAASNTVLREPINVINAYKSRVDDAVYSLNDAVNNKIYIKKQELAALAAGLDALSPLKVLARGYTIASDKNGIIESIDMLACHNKFSLVLRDGEAYCEVLDVRKDAEKP